MENVNFNAMAKDIYTKLNEAEERQGVKNGSDIGYSIWNKFVGEGQPEGNVIGTEKSRIRNAINMDSAIKSIISYLKNNGVEKVKAALANIGITWTPKSSYAGQDVSKGVDKSGNASPENYDVEQRALLLNEREKEKATKGMGVEKAFEYYHSTAEIDNAISVIAEIRSNFLGVGQLGTSQQIKDEDIPAFLDNEIAACQSDLSGTDRTEQIELYTKMKAKCQKALAVKARVLEKHPELANDWNKKVIKETGKYVARDPFYNQKANGMDNIRRFS